MCSKVVRFEKSFVADLTDMIFDFKMYNFDMTPQVVSVGKYFATLVTI